MRLALAASLAGTFVLCCPSSVLAQPNDLDSAKRAIVEGFRRHRTLAADLSMTTEAIVQGSAMAGRANGRLELLRDGGQVRLRVELESEMNQRVGARDVTVKHRFTTVIDGEFQWELSESFERVNVRKRPIDPQRTGDPAQLFGELAKEGQLRRLPDADVNGIKTTVIEFTPTDPAAVPFSRQEYAFDPALGFAVRVVTFDQQGKPMTTLLYRDFKVDEKIDPERFKFTPPPGADVRDETK